MQRRVVEPVDPQAYPALDYPPTNDNNLLDHAHQAQPVAIIAAAHYI